MQDGQALTGMEQVVAQVIDLHPEYHHIFSNADNVDQDFPVEAGQANPFLHMGLHISLHEQLATDRPAGIRDLYQQLRLKFGDHHRCEHEMMDCLAESLWQAQRAGQAPSEQDYLLALRRLLDQA